MSAETHARPLRVVVSATREHVRYRLASVLTHPDVSLRACISSPESLAEQAGGQPDALVLDGESAPRGPSPAVAAARAATEAAIVCVVDRVDWRGVRAIIGAGARGIVLAAEIEGALVSAVRAASAGQLVLPDALADQIARPVLSPREKQILGMVVMGLKNAEIAETLFISEATVKSHLSTAFAKLGVRSRGEAAALILDPEHGLGVGILAISGERGDSRRAPLPGVR